MRNMPDLRPVPELRKSEVETIRETSGPRNAKSAQPEACALFL